MLFVPGLPGYESGSFVAVRVLLHTLPVTGNVTSIQINDAAGLDFVLVELDLAATFCEAALSTRVNENKERNARNARKAYDNALYFLQKVNPDAAEQGLLNEKLSRLDRLLERLK
jgi:hypothetical protein